jgi:hypothetical protein
MNRGRRSATAKGATSSVFAVVRKLIGGVVLVSAVTLGVTLPAFADSTCYTGCTNAPPGQLGPAPGTAPSGPPVLEPTSVPGGLPLTGADIEESVAVASVLLVAGVVLVRINRRRAQATP